MNEAVRPSKQFLIRGSIAIGIVAIVLIVQTDWFRALLHKKPLPPPVSTKTVGEFVAQDTNGNGIADWEEKLWGLDPTVLYTNGVSNKQIIDQKKQALGVTNGTSTQPENETDSLARELLTITAALGQSGEITKEDLAAVGAQLAHSVELTNITTHYSLKDLQTVPTTTASLTAYFSALQTLNGKYSGNVAEIDIVITALETGDTSRLPELSTTKTLYERYAKELVALPTPIGVEGVHLEMANSIYSMAASLGLMAELSDNGVNALAGVALYKISDERLTAAVANLQEYLIRYGILQE